MSDRNQDRSIFLQTLLAPGNLVLLGIGLLFVVDLLLGSPLTHRVLDLTSKLPMNEPGRPVKIVTIFGTFTDRLLVARLYDYVGMGIPGLILIPAYLHSALVSLKRFD